MKENGYVCNKTDGTIDLSKDGKLEEVSCNVLKYRNIVLSNAKKCFSWVQKVQNWFSFKLGFHYEISRFDVYEFGV